MGRTRAAHGAEVAVGPRVPSRSRCREDASRRLRSARKGNPQIPPKLRRRPSILPSPRFASRRGDDKVPRTVGRTRAAHGAEVAVGPRVPSRSRCREDASRRLRSARKGNPQIPPKLRRRPSILPSPRFASRRARRKVPRTVGRTRAAHGAEVAVGPRVPSRSRCREDASRRLRSARKGNPQIPPKLRRRPSILPSPRFASRRARRAVLGPRGSGQGTGSGMLRRRPYVFKTKSGMSPIPIPSMNTQSAAGDRTSP